MTNEEIKQILYYTLGGLKLLKEHYKNFEMMTGSYAQHQYNGLSEAEHLAKQYLLELQEEN